MRRIPQQSRRDIMRDGGAVEMGLNSEDPLVLLLLHHCREMKQQDARFRLASLLLLLACAGLFVFGICADFTHRRAAEASVQLPAYSKQDNPCPEGEASRTGPPPAARLRIHLNSVDESKLPAVSYIAWSPQFGGDNGARSPDGRAIVIPESGQYFVYMKFMLRFCDPQLDRNSNRTLKSFHVKLQKWNEGYPSNVDLTEVRESGKCPQLRFRTIFMGELFDLSKGDHLKVSMNEGYKLIHRSSFGAFWA